VDLGLEALDELVGLPTGELAGCLALRESHWSAGIAIIRVPCGFEELEELSELLAVRWWTGRLTKRHAALSHTGELGQCAVGADVARATVPDRRSD
jgi:hypothetical protein|tara:strand:- start:1239 stop:1526 length:288 start_codon:yes stop_codon:yes gene_type:complete